MDNDSIKTRIDDFLSGRLTAAEKTAFLKEVESNKSLEEALTLTYLEKEMAELMAEDKINAYVQSLHKDNRAGQATRKSPRLWLMGLGILLLTAIAVWLFFPTKPYSNSGENTPSTSNDTSALNKPSAQKTDSSGTKSLNDVAEAQQNKLPPSGHSDTKNANEHLALALDYAKDFQLELELKGLSNTRRGSNTTKNTIDSLISEERYKEAAAMLEKTNPEAATDRYKLGICLFLDRDYRKAITVFEALKANTDSDNYYQTEYLLLLSYLADGRTNEFLALGAIVSNPSHQSDYQSQAKKLIADWRNLNR